MVTFIEISMSSKNTNHQLIFAVRKRDLSEVQRLLQLPDCDPSFSNSEAFRNAVSYGELEIARILLPKISSELFASISLVDAASRGNLEMVSFLLPFCHSNLYVSTAFRTAIEKGILDIFKLILSQSPKKVDASSALIFACRCNQTEMTKILLPLSTPPAHLIEGALSNAIQSNFFDIAKLLFPVCDVSRVVNRLTEQGHDQKASLLESMWQEEMLKRELEPALGSTQKIRI